MEYLYGVIIIVGLYVILATSFNLDHRLWRAGLDRASGVLCARRLYVGDSGA